MGKCMGLGIGLGMGLGMGLGTGLTLLLPPPLGASSDDGFTSNEILSWNGINDMGWRDKRISSYSFWYVKSPVDTSWIRDPGL